MCSDRCILNEVSPAALQLISSIHLLGRMLKQVTASRNRKHIWDGNCSFSVARPGFDVTLNHLVEIPLFSVAILTFMILLCRNCFYSHTTECVLTI